MAISKLKKSILPLLVATTLAGCHPFVKYPHPAYLSKQTAAGTAGGAATGAVIGSAAGAASIGIGAGALAGAGIATLYHSTPHWLKVLKKEGVQVIQTGQKVKIVIPSDKVFIFNTDSLLPKSYPILVDVTQFIQNYGRTHITVTGYTDNVGSAYSDLKLSLSQAKSVMAFFWSHGIPSSNLKAVGRGQFDPIADNFDSLGSAYNRRVEVTFAFG